MEIEMGSLKESLKESLNSKLIYSGTGYSRKREIGKENLKKIPSSSHKHKKLNHLYHSQSMCHQKLL